MAEQKSFSMTHDVLHVCLHDVQYELTLVASDSLNEKATTVVIHVNDVNDMPPVFKSAVYPAVMKEELPGPYPHKLLQVIRFLLLLLLQFRRVIGLWFSQSFSSFPFLIDVTVVFSCTPSVRILYIIS